MTTKHKTAEDILTELNPQQKEAVLSSDRQLLLLAGAGTGKTHTLISKILYQTEILNVDPTSILALTFTNAAGSELLTRYKMNSENTPPTFCTFHSFCYKLLCLDENLRKVLGYSEIPDVIDSDEENIFFEKAQLLTSVKLPKRAYKINYKYKDSEKFEFEIFQKTVKKLLIQSNKITFDRLCFEVSNLFIQKSDVVSKYFKQFKTIYVDEFQDTDPIQWEFVKSFKGYASIVICGDIRQAIYQFRGADSSIIKSLLDDKEWKLIKLETNYRSTTAICNYANQFVRSTFKDDKEYIELKAYSEELGRVAASFTSQDWLSLINISQELEPSESSAILCRSNQEVSKICDTLKKVGISFHTKLHDDTIKLYGAALDDNLKEVYFLSLLSERDRTDYLSRKFRSQLINLENLIKCKYPDAIQRIAEVEDNDNFADIKRLYDLKELTISDLYTECISEDDSIYVGTIHSVKGLEFETVYVYGVNGRSFQITRSEELSNLFYVAITRAKKNLFILQG